MDANPSAQLLWDEQIRCAELKGKWGLEQKHVWDCQIQCGVEFKEVRELLKHKTESRRSPLPALKTCRLDWERERRRR